MHEFIGKQINQYRITDRLGQGGMAIIYKAYDTRLEREVAIKLIRTQAIPARQHERLMKRFQREAKAQAQFNHPNIVPVFDYGVHEGMPYLVMEYISGGTLKDHMQSSVGLQQALDWVLPIADALQYAHDQAIVHRDVKPSNILITPEGKPMLTDFGIAKVLESNEGTLTATGMGIGTPEYMAPEQWQGKSSPATDQYALGVVLFELLTGQKPFTAETPMALALKQLNDPLTRPSALAPEISEHVEKVLFTALAKKPQDRYPGLTTFQQALTYAAGLRVRAHKLGDVADVKKQPSTEKPKMKARWLWASGSIAVVIVSILSFLVFRDDWDNILRRFGAEKSAVNNVISSNAQTSLTPTSLPSPTSTPEPSPTITETPTFTLTPEPHYFINFISQDSAYKMDLENGKAVKLLDLPANYIAEDNPFEIDYSAISDWDPTGRYLLFTPITITPPEYPSYQPEYSYKPEYFYQIDKLILYDTELRKEWTLFENSSSINHSFGFDPNTQFVSFCFKKNEKSHLYLFDIQNEKRIFVSEITSCRDFRFNTTWQDDSKFFYYLDGHPGIIRRFDIVNNALETYSKEANGRSIEIPPGGKFNYCSWGGKLSLNPTGK